MSQQSQHRNHPLILSALSLATGLMLTAGGSWSPALAQPKSIEAGYDLLERGWVDDAIREFQRAVQQQPESVSAQLGLAIAYERAGQDANAWQAYQKVLDLEPQNQRALTAVGTLGGYRPEWQVRGIDALDTLLTLTPQNLEARAQRALLLGYQGRFVAAIADYEILLDRSPTPSTLVAAAQIYTYSGDFSRGLALFERYLASGEPLTEAAAIAYAQTLSRAGRAAEAVAILDQRLQAEPDSVELRAAIAAAYSRNDQTEQAVAALAPLRNDAGARLPLARALSAIGRQSQQPALYREAIALYQEILADTPQPSDGFLIEVADVLSEDSAYQAAALQLYDTALSRLPGEPTLVTKRMITAYELGELTAAELNQELLMLLQPLPTGIAVQQQIGQALIRLRDPDPSLLPIYTDLIAAGTTVDFLYFRLAQMQIARENWTAARAAIATYRATSTSRNDFAPDLLLAELERRQGNIDVSIQQYEAIFEQADSPSVKASALLGLGGLRQSQRQWAAALTVYERLLALQPDSDRAELGTTYLALKLRRTTPAQARTVLDTWLASYPVLSAATVTPELLDLVGELPPESGQLALYEQLLAIAPTHLGLNRRYAQTLAMTDPETALLYLEAIAPDDPAEIDFYFVQGEVAQTLGELELASLAYETILVQEPDNVDALAALGGVRFQQRRLEEAELLYEEVLVFRPNDWDTRRILAELQLAQDEPIAAIQQFGELAAEADGQITEPPIDHRIQEIRLNFLRRRGFQPYWEQY